MEPTEEMKRMARRIAAHALCGPEKWKPGVKAGMYESIIRGEADNEALVLGPLAAIMETSEMAANMLGNGDNLYGWEWAERLRSADHLKDSNHV
ncbi:hypothetical protein [Sphingopyxis macrogoltabida]|uniref:Uncharacterized protein n=1 Tax=Sphingopyxis macrogoltabida TaxID=33050 RepID=A0AAC8Z1J8_SPHMC|nr:hypothetical protein [Sphingopyxis macrogoltabida]ALJ12659.1 hypothetical protein LH19_07245 [Sphingopyxis macrogoltabida]AMU89872.1 hypothetical protein ATM17_12585 [Sphingopyxis macrogoltabida]